MEGEELAELPEDVLNLLQMCVGAFNKIPNRSLQHNQYRNTYSIATQIDKILNKYKDGE